MNGMLRAASAEGMVLVRKPMAWILLVVLFAYMLLVYGSFALLLAAPAGQGIDAELLLGPIRAGGTAYLAQIFGGIASIVVIVLASSMIGQEFAKGTLRTWLLSGARRTDVVAAMLVVLLLACALTAILGAAMTLAGGAALGAAAGEDLLQGAPLVIAADVFLRLLFMLATWGLIAFAATLLTRSLLVGIGGTLALQLIGGVAAGLIAALGDAGRIASRFVITTAIDRVTVPPEPDLAWSDVAWITAALVAYVALPLWWAVHRFRRMDVTTG